MGVLKEPSFYKLVKKNIEKIREQGEPPRADLSSFESMDKYVCDLCKASISRSSLIQCSFCGRWICRDDCFDREDVSCLNCHGVIKLLRESQKMGMVSKRRDVLLEDKRAAQHKERRYEKKKEDLERKKRIKEMEFESKMDEVEQKRKIRELDDRPARQGKGSGLLNAIKKMKKMKDSDHDDQ